MALSAIKKIVGIISVGLLCVTAQATDYTLVSNGNWSVTNNWSPFPPPATNAWTAADRGIISGKVATANCNFGTAGDRPTMYVYNSGAIVRSIAQVDTPIIVDGGAVTNIGGNVTWTSLVVTNSGVIVGHDFIGFNVYGTIISTGATTVTTLTNSGIWAASLKGDGAFKVTPQASGGDEMRFDPTVQNSTFTGGAIVQGGANSAQTAVLRTQGKHALSISNWITVASNVTWFLDEYSPDINGPRNYNINLGPKDASIDVSQCYLTNSTINVYSYDSRIRSGTIYSWITGTGVVDIGGPSLTVNIFNPSNNVAGWKVRSSGVAVFAKTGSHGFSPIELVSAGSVVSFNATPDQDWTVTNRLCGLGRISLEGGDTNTTQIMNTAGELSPACSNAYGNLRMSGRLNMLSGASFTHESTMTPSMQYDSLIITGRSLAVTGNLNLVFNNIASAYGTNIIPIIINGGTGLVSGTFNDLPHNTPVMTNNRSVTVNYAFAYHGDGRTDDIVMSVGDYTNVTYFNGASNAPWGNDGNWSAGLPTPTKLGVITNGAFPNSDYTNLTGGTTTWIRVDGGRVTLTHRPSNIFSNSLYFNGGDVLIAGTNSWVEGLWNVASNMNVYWASTNTFSVISNKLTGVGRISFVDDILSTNGLMLASEASGHTGGMDIFDKVIYGGTNLTVSGSGVVRVFTNGAIFMQFVASATLTNTAQAGIEWRGGTLDSPITGTRTVNIGPNVIHAPTTFYGDLGTFNLYGDFSGGHTVTHAGDNTMQLQGDGNLYTGTLESVGGGTFGPVNVNWIVGVTSLVSRSNSLMVFNGAGNVTWHMTNKVHSGDAGIRYEAGDVQSFFYGGSIIPDTNKTLSLRMRLNMTNSPQGACTLRTVLNGPTTNDYSYLSFTGSIFRLGNADLSITKNPSWTPNVTDRLVVVNYQMNSNILGTFNSYTNNSTYTFADGWTAQICYTGNWDGTFTNDAMLYNWIGPAVSGAPVSNQKIPMTDNVFWPRNVFLP